MHRWFRYSAGFSATWAKQLIEREKLTGRHHVLDPFAGSGTVLLEGEGSDVPAIGIEAHPFVQRIAQAKLYWRQDARLFRKYALSILKQAEALGGDPTSYPRLIQACFPPESLSRLDTLWEAWQATADASPLSELTWLALCSILRDCSPVGTAQWQYVLPNKTKARALDPYEAFCTKVYLMADDIARRQRSHPGPQARLYRADARDCALVPDGWADLVVTSPPYANNYDYADATRLEMTFFGEVRGWGDLQAAVRAHLVRSCTQHVAPLAHETGRFLSNPLLEPIRTELTDICEQLEAEREKHGGKKPYHTMVAAYFSDMAHVWVALRRATRKGALVCFVVGDSAPYGIHVPVDRWLGELARAAGFASYSFEKTRDRNIKWQNRKHRVPLHEGRLWVEG
ncbi:MAG: DNA modification methylase [Chloroflexi bacterium]|nr:DNA modification methylase [Chloroflexota bacterium]